MKVGYLVNTIKGKIGGRCNGCDLLRGDWELKGSECGRCGEIFKDDPVIQTVDGTPIEETPEIPVDK